MPSPLEIATFRFEQIAPLVDESLSAAEKRRVRQERSRHAAPWPNGRKKPIPRATLHRWLALFTQHGFAGLLPPRRKDRGRKHRETTEIVEYAIALLLERLERSLFLVGKFFEQRFAGYDLPRATLARHIKAHPAYPAIDKLRRTAAKLRGRYEAHASHECWQLDGKGPFPVRLLSGEVVRVHVLTVLDDYSRAVLAGAVATAEDERAAIRVFQKAALRFGLPGRMQFDCGSAFDGQTFRHGLAQLGVHRNAVRARNPQALGKTEAFNKSLGKRFVKELKVQEVHDLEHLQQLLDALLDVVYQQHPHRALKTTPEERLAGQISKRLVSERDLVRAFFVTQRLKSDRITGEVALQSGRFVVPEAYAGRRSSFRFDPLRPFALLVTHDGREIELQPFAIRPLPKPVVPDRTRPAGQLQMLLDHYQGRTQKNAEPAFGLPGVFAALSSLVLRRVPNGEAEAQLVLAFWNRFGPIARRPFLTACGSLQVALGNKRPRATSRRSSWSSAASARASSTGAATCAWPRAASPGASS